MSTRENPLIDNRPTSSKTTIKRPVIVFVVEDVIPSGQLTLASEVSKVLVSLGYDLRIIYFQSTCILDIPNYFSHIPPKSIYQIKIFLTGRLLVLFERFVKTWLFLFSFQRLPIVAFHCFLPLSFFATYFHPIRLNRRCIYHFIGYRDLEMLSTHQYRTWPPQDKFSLSVQVRKQILFYIQKFCLNISPEIIAISNYAKKLAISRYNVSPNKITIIRCTVDVSIFNSNTHSNIRKMLGLSRKCALIIFIHRHDPRKGFTVFLEAMAHLAKTGLIFHIVIAGEKTYYTQFIKNYCEMLGLSLYVTFVHTLTRTELVKFYNSADLSIISSLDLENFGQVIIEAFACGCPVIGTPTGAIPETLNLVHSFNLCCRNVNSTTLAKKIHSYLSLPRAEKLVIKREIIRVAGTQFATSKASSWYQSVYPSINNYKVPIN